MSLVGIFLFALMSGSLTGSALEAPSTKSAAPKAHSPSEATHLEHLDEAKLHQLVHERHGRALFVNVWATWCVPCTQEFPDIVKLADEMKGKNIDFVGVSADDFGDEIPKVLPFIGREHASFKFYIAGLEGNDHFINAFDPKWGGGLPATFVFDARGNLRTFLLGKQTYASLRKAVLAVLPGS